jgi:hypothetical protein
MYLVFRVFTAKDFKNRNDLISKLLNSNFILIQYRLNNNEYEKYIKIEYMRY